MHRSGFSTGGRQQTGASLSIPQKQVVSIYTKNAQGSRSIATYRKGGSKYSSRRRPDELILVDPENKEQSHLDEETVYQSKDQVLYQPPIGNVDYMMTQGQPMTMIDMQGGGTAGQPAFLI